MLQVNNLATPDHLKVRARTAPGYGANSTEVTVKLVDTTLQSKVIKKEDKFYFCYVCS